MTVGVRAGIVASTLAVLLAGLTAASAAPQPSHARRAAIPSSAGQVTYSRPTTGAVVRSFDPPAGRFGPGHLGVDLAAPAASAVRSAGAGTVTFAGPVAGRSVVVVRHPDGIRTEYEPVRPSVRAGQGVARGQVIGRVDGVHAGCSTSCLHWGARRGDVYLDPLSLLSPLGPVRLLPWRPG